MKKPYFPFYPGDYLSDTLGLSCCQHGVYLLLLAVSWQRGPLPDDMDHLARLAADPPIEALRFILENYWTLEKRGWINKRLELERKILAEKFSKRSVAGKKAIDARWSKAKEHDTNRIPIVEQSYTNQNQNQNHIHTQTQNQNQDTPQTPQGGIAPETPIDEAHQDLAPAEPQPTKSAKHRKPSKPRAPFVVPSTDDVAEYCRDRGNSIDPNAFVDHYESKGWVVGKSPMRDWKAAVRTWERNGYETGNGGRSNGKGTGAAPKVFVPDYGVESDANVIEGEFRREVG